MTADESTTETYREWRLTGQPEGPFPFYDCTFHDDERIKALQHIWSKIASGEYRWTDAKLQFREVTITRTAWQDARLDEQARPAPDTVDPMHRSEQPEPHAQRTGL